MLSNFSATDPLRVKAVALMRNRVCKNAIRKIKCCDLSTRPVNETIIDEDENVQVYLSISTKDWKDLKFMFKL